MNVSSVYPNLSIFNLSNCGPTFQSKHSIIWIAALVITKINIKMLITKNLPFAWISGLTRKISRWGLRLWSSSFGLWGLSRAVSWNRLIPLQNNSPFSSLYRILRLGGPGSNGPVWGGVLFHCRNKKFGVFSNSKIFKKCLKKQWKCYTFLKILRKFGDFFENFIEIFAKI